MVGGFHAKGRKSESSFLASKPGGGGRCFRDIPGILLLDRARNMSLAKANSRTKQRTFLEGASGPSGLASVHMSFREEQVTKLMYLRYVNGGPDDLT